MVNATFHVSASTAEEFRELTVKQLLRMADAERGHSRLATTQKGKLQFLNRASALETAADFFQTVHINPAQRG